ncbi:TetR/AcrR family transcriptional regulator [Clostridium swellfunianum]|uniref:TetR/AcrR family transcriptional regulator n=1 Tax=Clostridium swellfunianum TaxID=1367462 RepID=UPI002030D2F5|nr:TetR/AcrR family transcriptional regulator [Clostridium swellfunianum]
MNGYEKRTEEKKEVILSAAQDLFFHNGIANTSVVDIAKKANVSKVTIFNYFGSKEALAREVLQRYISNIVSVGEKILKEQIPFAKKLEKLFGMAEEKQSLFATDVFSKEAWEDPMMQQLYSEKAKNVMPFVFDFFEQGKKEGDIDASIPTEAVIAYISAITPLLNPGKHDANRDYIVGINKLFYYGLFGDKSNFDDMIKTHRD